jgi:uncharacterized membrane protein
MKNSDASYVIGFLYLFPIVVAVLSFIFLSERLPVLTYIAVALILTGVILLSVRAKKIKAILFFLPLLIYILLLGGYEFFIKVSTNNLNFMQGVAITTFVSGSFILFGLFSRKIRKEFIIEIKNIKFAFINEFIALLGVFTLFFAMSLLPATIVSSIGSIQPLAVIILERLAHKRFGKITIDTRLLPKLIAILLIVIGVIVLSILSS